MLAVLVLISSMFATLLATAGIAGNAAVKSAGDYLNSDGISAPDDGTIEVNYLLYDKDGNYLRKRVIFRMPATVDGDRLMASVAVPGIPADAYSLSSDGMAVLTSKPREGETFDITSKATLDADGKTLTISGGHSPREIQATFNISEDSPAAKDATSDSDVIKAKEEAEKSGNGGNAITNAIDGIVTGLRAMGAFAVTRAANIPSSVTVVSRGYHILYGTNNTVERYNDATGHVVICMTPKKVGVGVGATETYDNTMNVLDWHDGNPWTGNNLRTLAYFGYGGPGFDSNDQMWYMGGSDYFKGAGLVDNEAFMFLYTHVMMADCYTSNFDSATAGMTPDQKTWINNNVLGDGGLRSKILAKESQVPDNFVAYIINQNGQYNHQSYLTWDITPTGKGRVRKVSSNADISNAGGYSLANAVYGIYSDANATQEVTRVTTGADGTSEYATLDAGTYYVKEISAPANFRLNDAIVPITITSNGEAEVTLEDAPMVGKLKVEKKSADTGKIVQKAGFVFNVTGPKSFTLTTGPDGTATSGELPLGSYTVTEVTAPKPWILNKTSTTVNLTQDGVTVTATVSDKMVKGRIKVTKTDKEFGKPIENVKFEITSDAKVAYPDGTTQLYSAGQKVATLTTGPDGTATSDELWIDASGTSTFTVTETYVPKPYTKTEAPKKVTLSYKDQNTPVVDFSVGFENDIATTHGELDKADSETGKAIKGVTFDVVVTKAVTLPNGYVIYPAGKVIETITTDANGHAETTSDKLYLDADGTSHYAFEEKTVPVPYYIPAGKQKPITASYKDSATERVDGAPVKFQNTPQKGRITVHKTDNVTKTKVKEAKFDVVATKDIIVNGDVKAHTNDVVQHDLTTGDDGTATSEELYISSDGTGWYKVVETYVPEPFAFYKEPGKHEWEANIPYAGATVDVTDKDVSMENLLPYGAVDLTKTEDVTGGPVEGAVFDVVVVEDVKVPNGTIVSKDGKTYSKGTVIETITTDSKGKASSTKPLYIGRDSTGKAVGHYKLVEKHVGQPYWFKDGEYAFDLAYEGMNTEVLTKHAQIHAVNKVQYGNVKLHKDEDVGNKGVPEAVFELRATKDVVLPNGNVIYKKDQVIQVLKTDRNGDAASTDDDEGKRLYLDKDGHGLYYLYEMTPGGAYAFPEKGRKYEFDLEYADDRTEKVEYGTTVKVTNRVPYAAGVKITKRDEEDGSALDGATFELRADEDVTLSNGFVVYKKDQLIDTLTTDARGEAESTKKLYNDDDDSDGDGVKDGLYYLKETHAPEGHVTVEKPYPVVVKYQGTETPIIKIDSVNPTDKPNELDLSKSVIAKDGQTFDDTTVEGATFRLWKKEDELPVTPQEGKDAYALRVDDGSGEHEVALSKPVGYAEVITAEGMDGYAVAVRDSKGNMTKAGTKDAPAKVTTTGEDGLDLDVIITGADGKALTGLTGDKRVTVHDGDSITIGLDGTTAENGKDDANTNENANTNDNTNKAGDTKAAAENANANANSGTNEAGNSEANSNANDTTGAAGRSVSVEWNHVEGAHLEPKAVSGAYVFDDLEPGATYNVMVDKKAVYRLDTNAEDSKDTNTGSKEDTENGSGNQDNKEDQTENAGPDAGTGDGNETETDDEADNGSDDPDVKGGRVFYGRLDTTATHYAYKRQPILLTSDDKFIDKFTINGKDYPVETKTNAEGKIVIKRIKTGEYGFGETDVPFVGDKGTDGSDRTYLINTNVFRFTVDDVTGRLNDKEVLGTDFADDWTRTDISKNEITGGPEIPGAHLEIRDSDDKVVEQWTSTDTPHRVDRLTPGRYTLVEVMTPNNYDQATRVEFTVYDTGEVQKVEMHDKPISINAQIDKRQEIADPVAADTEPNGDGKNRAEVTQSDEGKFRYSLDYRNDSTTWVDEFTVYDPLDGVAQGLVRLNGLTTAQAYQDFDGKMNVWFQTNKTPAEYDGDQYKANATKDDGHVNQWLVNPNDDIKGRDADGDGRILSYVGWRLWRKDVSVTQATSLSVADLGLASDEYVTGIRLEYGRVERGFTTRPDGWDRADLKDAHDDMRPIEQVHEGTFSGSSRDAVLSRLALMRSFVASVVDGIETKSADGDGNQDANGNVNTNSNANANAGGNASTKAADGNDGNGAASDGNVGADGEENGNATAGSPGAVVSLADEVSAALDRCEERVREALDSQDDAAVSAAMHDARNEVVRLIDAAMAKEGTDKDSLASMVDAVDAAYGAVSAGLDEDTAKDAQAGIDEAKRAATASDAAAVRKNLGNAISDAIDGLVMDESYGRILKNEATDSGDGKDAANTNDAADDGDKEADGTMTNGNVNDVSRAAESNVNAASENGTDAGDESNAIHYSATILDMQVTDAYVPGTNLDNSAYVDAYRNGGGEGLEGHDNDKVTQTPRQADLASDLLAQTGDGTRMMAVLSGTTAATIAGIALVRRKRA